MDEYIEYVADTLLAYLEVPRYYNTLNPVSGYTRFLAVLLVLTSLSVYVYGCNVHTRAVKFL